MERKMLNVRKSLRKTENLEKYNHTCSNFKNMFDI